jgi:monoamine oxidase
LRVTTAAQIFTADYVLITVPLGVLKKNVIQFAPELPANKTLAINGLGMGQVNKFLLHWDKPFWNNDLQYIGYTPEEKGKFNYFLNVYRLTQKPALMTFALGNYAVATEAMTDVEVIEAIMGHLRKIYGNMIPTPIGLQRTRWASNNFSFGAYSFIAAGSSSQAFDELAAPVANKLFFAGEHTHRLYRGTVHGAYLSGIKAAEAIVKA